MDIWIDKETHYPWERTKLLINRFYKELEKNPNVKHVKSGEDLKSDSKIKVILGIEGGEAIEGSFDRLYEVYKLGVRLIGLTWNTPNEISDTAASPKNGLTEFGRQLIPKMESLNMMVDVSHISEKGFWDVCEISKKPFIASHSNSKTIKNHNRNLTDEQFKALIKKGGVAGINLYPLFLGENANISTAVSHIEHFLSLGGEDNIGIGADFDGIDFLPAGISGSESLHNLLNELLKLNYNEKIVRKIAKYNFQRVFIDVLC